MSSSSTSTTAMASSAHSNTVPPKYRPVGIALAIGSGLLIGSSFVFKKKGLLSSQKDQVAGEGVAYLKNPLWWTGMTIMILGEICNLVAYSFLEAIIVTPLGALSVVISAILSHFFLKEKLSLFGWISSFQCLIGATILALNGPEEQSVTTIAGFKALFLAPGFLAYGSVLIAASVFIAVYVAPRWGQRSMLPHLGICSLIGGLSVSCTQGFGACVVTSIRGENQFKNWFIYFLLGFVIITLLTEVYYLNVALALFNTAMVTPTYYVMFTFCTLVTSVILYQGLKASGTQIMTVVLAFFVICTGIFILQMSKVDPRELVNVDEHTTLLLQAARAEIDPKAARDLERDLSLASHLSRRRTGTSAHTHTRTYPGSRIIPVNGADLESILPIPSSRSGPGDEGGTADGLLLETDVDPDEEVKAIVEKTEEPGIDALRAFGTIGTIIRARKRRTVLAQVLQHQRSRTESHASQSSVPMSFVNNSRSHIRPSQSKDSRIVPDPEKQAIRTPSLMSETPSGTSSVNPPLLTASPDLNRSPRLPTLPSIQFSDIRTDGGSAPVTIDRKNEEPNNTDPLDRAGASLTQPSPQRAHTLPAILKRAIPVTFLNEKKDA